MSSKFWYTLIYTNYAIFSILGGPRASIRNSAHPILLQMYKYLLILHKIAHSIYYIIPISIQHLHTAIKNLVTYAPFMTPLSHTSSAISLEKRQSNKGLLIHCPSAPHKAILLNSQQTKTTHVRSFICCSIRFVSLSLPTHMVSKHTMELKTAVGPVQARGVADSYTPIHTYTYALTDKHTVTCELHAIPTAGSELDPDTS